MKYSYNFLIGNLKEKKDFKLNYLRDIVIIPLMVGKTLDILNGKSLYKFKVKENMVGFKIGEFVFNRAVGKIHSLEKKKRKLNRKKK